MFDVDDFLKRVADKKIGTDEASAAFARFSDADKARILSALEQGAPRNGTAPHDDVGAAPHSSAPARAALTGIRTNQTCTPHQRSFIENFVARHSHKTRTSKRLAERYRAGLADQRTPANFNILLKEIQYPLTFKSASGSHLEDVDGNRYIDIAGDFGVNLFGHAPEFLRRALIDQVERGWALSGRYEALGEASELFCELTGQERVAFCQSGTEALMCAVRLARAHTDRQKIAVFTNSYHGHADIFLNPYIAGVSENSSHEVIPLEYGAQDALAEIEKHAGELAAVVVEPVQSEHVDKQPFEFLKQLRALTRKHRIVLVFDEMITGFRAHPKGFQGVSGIDADLATYGKILGGGITAGAVAGRAEIMDWCDGGNWRYGDSSKPGVSTYIAGTHTQNPIKMAATLAVLKELKRLSPGIQRDLSDKTTALVERINAYARQEGLPFEAVSFCSQFRFRFRLRQFTLTQALFLHLLKDRGINYYLHGNCFLTTAHGDAELDAIFAAVRDSLDVLRREEFFYDGAKRDAAEDDDRAPMARGHGSKPVIRPEPAAVKVAEPRPIDVAPPTREPPAEEPARAARADIATLDEQRVIAGLKDLVGKFLELSPDDFDEEDDLANLGVDSIIMTGILKAISSHFGVKLSLKKLDGASTIGEVARALCREILVAEPLGDGDGEDADVDAKAMEADAAPLQVAGAREPEIPFVEAREPTNGASHGANGNGRAHASSRSHDGAAARQRRGSDDIAIVGMSAAFPGAPNLRVFWRNLLDGATCITEIPESRWNWKNVYAEFGGEHGTPWKWGGFVEGHDLFDPLFFRISPREAKYMDPQERLLLMHAYGALEDAGLNAAALQGSRTGVFVGYEYTDYAERLREIRWGVPDLDPMLGDLSGRPWNLANRLSFVFNWKGPSEAINVNCAGSAVSINRGCRSLTTGETDLVVAGGVCLNLLPSSHLNVAELLSPDGVVSVFGQSANGYVKGEGCGVVVLKRLEDALRENNAIYAVIRACQQGYRGQGNSLSEIRGDAIGELIQRCLAQADVAAETVGYMEVNGYSTTKGDAAEYEGIKAAVSSGRCALGSVKNNIGNLEPVSGVAGVAKVALAFEYGRMPRTVGVAKINEQIDAGQAGSPLRLLTATASLDELRADPRTPVRAGVNSFADSGVNVHILLEEPPHTQQPAASSFEPHIFVLSAKTKSAWLDYVRSWIGYLRDNPDADLARLAYTVQTGREAFPYRLACVARSVAELRLALEAVAGNGTGDGCYIGTGARKTGAAAAENGVARGGDPHAVAKRWADGESVDWYALHRGALPLPLHQLPTYPFSLKRYWLDVPAREAEAADVLPPTPPTFAAAPVTQPERPPAVEIPVAVEKPVEAPAPPASAPAPAPAAASMPAPVPLAAPVDSEQTLAVMKKLRAIVHGFLEIQDNDEINEHANFAEIGLTSMSIVMLIDEVNRQFGTALPEIIAFDYPNIVELSAHIAALTASAQPPALVPALAPAPAQAPAASAIDRILSGLASQNMSVDDALALIGRGD
ncbi:MAG: aminotransferase class III-fold pyridoxal phosphate-dependent enzyme [Alphaproteobacteria bacterium]|nr:aminotransferase class III-fold pyridoxal phosphate-dependent enzyme [Alphaproteobacteria bacterium]